MSQATQHAVPTGTWNADTVHSTVGFAVPYLMGTFQGTFSEFEARLSDGALSGSVEVSSVEVKDPNLEAHLQSPDFFDAERFPQLSFKANEISRAGNDLTIAGELTLKGHAEPVEISDTSTIRLPTRSAASASGSSSRRRSTGPSSG